MSRCFPFPPPGYAKNVSSYSEALIESIKLQNKSKKAKKDRKEEKRREKKDKRKDRKQKKGTASHSSNRKDSGFVQKGDCEQLETSDITEEHGRPISTLEPCCSDSTRSSSKRKRNTSPSSHDHGAVIKVSVSLRKHTEPEESKLEDRLISTSRSVGTEDTDGADHPLPCVTNTEAERDQSLGNYDSIYCEAAPNTNLLDVERMRMVSVYNSLIQDWVPPPTTCDGFKSEDRDWLFGSELQEERPIFKKVKAVTGSLRCSSASLWPRAQYLPEVESYALPYAVPF